MRMSTPGLTRFVVLCMAILAGAFGAAFFVSAQSVEPPSDHARLCRLEDRARINNPWCDPTTTSTTVPASTLPPTSSTTTTAATTTTSVAPTTAPTTTAPAPGVLFFEDFTDDTISDFTATFDWEVVDLWRRIVQWPGHHDDMCHGPDTTRLLTHHKPISNTDPQDEFWLCGPPNVANDHIMTANGENGTFGITAFSPKQSFTGNRVCWRNNLTVSHGRRHWFEVQLIRADAVANEKLLAQGGGIGEGMVAPGEVDVERGTARLAWGHGMDGTFMKRPWPSDSLVFDYTEELVTIWKGQTSRFHSPWVERFAPEDRATRYQTCLVDNGNNTVTFTQQRPVGGPGAPNGVYSRTVTGASFPKPYRVIFAAHNYNAGKDGTQPHQTWHWDDIEVGG